MKKKKFQNKLTFNKRVVSNLDSGKVSGGNGNISTGPQRIATGEIDGCVITCNCGGGTGGSGGCNITQQIISCLVECDGGH